MIPDPAPITQQRQTDPQTFTKNSIEPAYQPAATTFSPALPAIIPVPWLWFWLITYLFALPALVENFFAPFLMDIFKGDANSAGNSFFEELASRGVSFVQLVPYTIVLLGIIYLLFPRLRAARVERKYNLKTLTPQQLPEIQAFLGQYAPDLIIKAGLLEKSQYALIYPTGYRSFAIAIFGPLARLWRQDPAAAKAVLLHEMAHYHSGDGHIQGAGSLFHWYIRSWLLILIVSLLLPFTLQLLSLSVSVVVGFFQNAQAASALSFLGWVGGYTLTQFIPMILLTMLNTSLATFSIIFMPLMGIWIAEINADYYAAQVLGDAQAVKRALNYVGQQPSFFVWLLRRMTHPPEFFRKAFLKLQNRTLLPVLILMLMTFAYLARLPLVFMNVILSGVMAGSLSLMAVVQGIGAWADSLSDIILVATLLLLVWPWIAPIWQRLFTKARLKPIQHKGPYFIVGAINFALSLLLALTGLILLAISR